MKKIIIVDDSRTARMQVKNVLTAASYEVVEAVDGKDGLEKIATHDDAALVLCDLNMPVLGGLEMLEEVPPQVRARITFLMLTTEAEPRLVQRAKELGAKGWIVKPFKPDLLRAAIDKLVG